MQKWTLAGSTALALIFASGAWADVTPEEVWQNWQDMSASYGQTISADSAERDGDTLVVTNLSISYDKDGVIVDGTLDEVNFTDLGDGTVEITMSDEYPIDMTLPPSDGTDGATSTQITLLVSQPGLKMIAGGSATETSYTFEAPTVGIKLDSIEGVDAQAVDATANVTLTAIAGKYVVTGTGEAKTLDSSFTAQGMSMVIDAKDSETNGSFRMTAAVADMAGSSKGSFLGMAGMADLSAALASGLAVDGGFTYGKTTFDLDVVDAGSPTKITGSADSGNFNVGIDKTRLLYGGGGKGMKINISGAEIPLPEVAISYGEAGFNLLMPVAKSDTPTDFAFLTKIVDLTLSDDIWGLIDPAASLPRGPATVILDTKGTARLTTDILDAEQAAAMGDAPPGEIYSLDVTELKASAVGAELTGSGAFTFDNTDKETFGGMPAPTGKLDLKLVGGNALLDKLVTMGLVPQDQADGARMMMGLFANMTGDDTMTSTLEFKDKGFFANGQRLQ